MLRGQSMFVFGANMNFLIDAGRAFVVCCLAAGPAFAQQTNTATSVPCEQGAIFAPGKTSMTLVLCSSVARDVPELKAHVLRVESMLASRDADVRRDIDLLRNAVNGLARQLKPNDVETLARSLAAKMAPSGVPDGRLLGELSRLRIDLREIQDKVDALRNSPATAEAASMELRGATGSAIAQFDFTRANDLLDGLTRVERKVDAVARDVQEILNPTESAALIAGDRRVAEDTWRRFLAAGGAQRCPVLHGELTQVLQKSGEVERSGGYGAARAMLATVMSRSNHATIELLNLDRRAEAARQAYDRSRADADRELKELDQRMQAAQERASDRAQSHQRSESAREAAAGKRAIRAEAEFQEATERVARAQAAMERAHALPSNGSNESILRSAAIQQTEQALKLAEIQLRNASRQKSGSNAGDSDKPASKGPRDPASAHLEHLRTARERLAAGVDLAARQAAEGRHAMAAASLKASLRDAQALRNGREPRPSLESSDDDRPYVLTACR